MTGNRQAEASTATPSPRRTGPWDAAVGTLHEWDPTWARACGSGTFSPKDLELLSIGFDASCTHMYAPGTRRHIRGVLKAGAAVEAIMEVLKLCVVQGVQACNLGVPILADELERRQRVGAEP